MSCPCLGESVHNYCPYKLGCLALGTTADCSAYRADDIAEKVDTAMRNVSKKINGHASCKDILLAVIKVIRKATGGIPKSYLSHMTELMQKRHNNELPYGGFKWGMIALYYEIMNEKIQNPFFAESLQPIHSIIKNQMESEDQEYWDTFGNEE